jgi:hypothetical protein
MVIGAIGGVRHRIFTPAEPFERLVSCGAKKVDARRRSLRVIAAFGVEKAQETLLHDVFGLRHRAGHPKSKPKEWDAMRVEQFQDGLRVLS